MQRILLFSKHVILFFVFIVFLRTDDEYLPCMKVYRREFYCVNKCVTLKYFPRVQWQVTLTATKLFLQVQ